jgi:hypothetical protein
LSLSVQGCSCVTLVVTKKRNEKIEKGVRQRRIDE